MKIQKKFILGILLMLVFQIVTTQVAFAEEKKDEWVNKNYDINKVHRVLIKPINVTAMKIDTFDEMRVNEFCQELKNHKKLQGERIRFVLQDDLLKSIGNIVDQDMQALAKSDPKKYQSLLDTYTLEFVDQVLEFDLVVFRVDKVFVPERRYTEIEYVDTVVITKKKGYNEEEKTTVRMPVERLKIVPAYYKNVANTGVKSVLKDAKTNENIFMVLDVRDSEYKGILPMTNRILERIGDRIAEFLKK